MVLAYRQGVALPAGVIRALIPGHSTHGETTATDLQDVLGLFHVAAVAMEVSDAYMRGHLAAYLTASHPVIVLGNWLDPHILHWVVAVGYGNGKLAFNEPFYGERRLEPWDWAIQRYAGDMVVS